MSKMKAEGSEEEELDEGESAVTKKDAPCPFLVLDALRDGKPHEYNRVIEKLAAVAAVSKRAEDNLYFTINCLASYDPPLIHCLDVDGVKYLIITDAGKGRLRWMKSLDDHDYAEYFIQEFMSFFNYAERKGFLKVVREEGRHLFIHMLDVEWFSLELDNTVRSCPRLMLALAEEALARLDLGDEPVEIHLIYPGLPFFYYCHLDPYHIEACIRGSLGIDLDNAILLYHGEALPYKENSKAHLR